MRAVPDNMMHGGRLTLEVLTRFARTGLGVVTSTGANSGLRLEVGVRTRRSICSPCL